VDVVNDSFAGRQHKMAGRYGRPSLQLGGASKVNEVEPTKVKK
jgi:hypothetical protein